MIEANTLNEKQVRLVVQADRWHQLTTRIAELEQRMTGKNALKWERGAIEYGSGLDGRPQATVRYTFENGEQAMMARLIGESRGAPSASN